MSQITVFFRADGWRNGIRWQGPAEPQTYITDSDSWYRLENDEQIRVLKRVTMMEYPEVDSIDHIAIEGTR